MRDCGERCCSSHSLLVSFYFFFLRPLNLLANIWPSPALFVATLTVFIRSVFRVAELSQGFGGSLANDEVTFMILEGAMIIIAAIVLTVVHPGFSFQGNWAGANFNLRRQKNAKRLNEGGDTPETYEEGVELGGRGALVGEASK